MVRALPQKLGVISRQGLVPSAGLSVRLCEMGWLQVTASKPNSVWASGEGLLGNGLGDSGC